MEELQLPGQVPGSSKSVAVRTGLLGGLALIAIGLVFQLTGVVDLSQQYSPGNLVAQFVSYIIMGATVYLATKKHRDENLQGVISLGKAFGVGMLTILILAVMQAVWTFVYMEFIDPDMVQELLDNAMDKALEQGQMTEEQMEASQGMFKIFTNPWVIAGFTLLGTLGVGVVISLIVGLILKKEPKQGVI